MTIDPSLSPQDETEDEDDRTRRLVREELGRNLLVEAGAGTGKTRALVERFCALVASGVAVDRIIAITFTEKAAAELKERVRGGLEALAAEGRIAAASASVDGAHISTIHAFCQELLRSFAAEAGIDPAFEVQDEVMAERWFEERWRLYLERCAEVPPARDAINRVLDLGLRTNEVAELARRLWERAELAPRLDATPLAAPAIVWPDLSEMSRRLESLTVGHVPETDVLRLRVIAVRQLVSLLLTAPADRELNLAARAAVLDLGFKNTGNIATWGRDRLAEARETCMHITETLKATLAGLRADALASLLPYVVDFVLLDGRERAREGRLTFDDLILRTRDLFAADGPSRAELQRRFHTLLIDEFQDTDPQQVSIATAFAQSGGRLRPGTLFLVGDPKQSIYRFRRADMEVYAEAARLIGSDGGLRPELTRNRRSQPAVLDWVNRVFEPLFGPFAAPELQAPYVPVRPARSAYLRGPGVATFGDTLDLSARESRTVEAREVAVRCRSVLLEVWEVEDRELGEVRQARYRDICVLIPTRAALLDLEQALFDAGVPYRVEGGSLVYATQEVRDLINCLAAIDDPADEVAVLGALRSTAYACSDLDIAYFRKAGGVFDYERTNLDQHDGPVAEALRSMRSFHVRRHDGSLARLVEQFVADRALVEIGIHDEGSRNTFRRARFVVEQARTFEANGPESLRAFIAWLERRAGRAILDNEGAGLDDDEDAVRILTVHAAKGLEFPIVILAGLGSEPRTDRPVFLASGAEIAVTIGAAARKTRFELGNVAALQAGDTRHSLAERDRVLYVAATRARDHLLVSLFHGRRATRAAAPRLIQYGARDHALELPPVTLPPAANAEPLANLHIDLDPAVSTEDFVSARGLLVAGARQVRYTSATGLKPAIVAQAIAASAGGSSDDKGEPDDESEPWSRGRAGTRLGRAIHAALQGVSWNATDTEVAAITRAQTVAEGVPEHAAEAAALVRAALATGAAVRARNAGRALREVPFALPFGSTILEGFIDLVIETDDGLEVVDWKTDHIAPGEVPARLREYELQAGLYVLGLESATDRRVTRITYCFVTAGVEDSPGDPATLRAAAEAALAS